MLDHRTGADPVPSIIHCHQILLNPGRPKQETVDNITPVLD